MLIQWSCLGQVGWEAGWVWGSCSGEAEKKRQPGMASRSQKKRQLKLHNSEGAPLLVWRRTGGQMPWKGQLLRASWRSLLQALPSLRSLRMLGMRSLRMLGSLRPSLVWVLWKGQPWALRKCSLTKAVSALDCGKNQSYLQHQPGPGKNKRLIAAVTLSQASTTTKTHQQLVQLLLPSAKRPKATKADVLAERDKLFAKFAK